MPVGAEFPTAVIAELPGLALGEQMVMVVFFVGDVICDALSQIEKPTAH